ncbi:hypothetical protein MIH18_00980 [Marinobacter sp. M3C]|jgi:hypothetical protein|uniref:hypothetical protein n=1 Tax=unclassified Marinobacter TaxID=83889 RepID=UPI00200D5902|nr:MULTISPECIES: hypothetical protein [unclassified Marinobacter]MCL1476218.1 hypothetical protein [Marinobacter sp.]MCL1482972.1 hypothetical protein [Marinobacter sp.]UQG58131.1 hypothetical protein MIH16_11075 [Marinobacter sp. M4C]UQG60571.1 hypothetical protein MIH18_00980 [Marinobacter sp. M3C]UQG66936.1 hypothetical protein MIH17_11080 [Marinobacter sp. M2C]
MMASQGGSLAAGIIVADSRIWFNRRFGVGSSGRQTQSQGIKGQDSDRDEWVYGVTAAYRRDEVSS